ncbi:hypothetical protein [Haloglomus litoreum]|uniref:hypothetical protein n=1 Tax=Haloglomus litoreum TaxID=3034026 RepID=UPI0023E8ADB2|nr:hypothetical protein [Haloglomus sp. DT116]
MEITITFRDGPIEAEIRTSEEEDYDKVLTELAEFVDGYGPVHRQQEPAEDGSEPETEEDPQQVTLSESSEESDEDVSNPVVAEIDATEFEFYSVLQEGRVNEDEVEEFPAILTAPDVLGDSEQERAINAAAVIMTVLSDIHDIERIKTSDLKSAVGESGIAESVWKNTSRVEERDVYFNSRGRGGSATVEIRPPGKAVGYEQIERLVDEYRSDSEE